MDQNSELDMQTLDDANNARNLRQYPGFDWHTQQVKHKIEVATRALINDGADKYEANRAKIQAYNEVLRITQDAIDNGKSIEENN